MIDTILWRFKDSAGHPACLTMGDIAIFAVMLLLLLLFCLLMAKRRKTCLRIRNYILIPLVAVGGFVICLLYTSPSPRDKRQSRMPSSA